MNAYLARTHDSPLVIMTSELLALYDLPSLPRCLPFRLLLMDLYDDRMRSFYHVFHPTLLPFLMENEDGGD